METNRHGEQEEPLAPPAAPGGIEAADFQTYDEYAEANIAAARRRKILIGMAIAIAAVVGPIASLIIAGKFSTSSLRQPPIVRPSAIAAALPTPIPLSPSERKARDQAIGRDLHDYTWTLLPPIAKDEKAAETAFASVTDGNYKNDKTSYGTIRDVVVPHFERFVASAAMLRPRTEQMRVVHHLMLTSARLKLMAYQQIASGESDKDRLWRLAAQADFAESARRADLYHKEIIGLAQATKTKLP